MGAKSTLRSFIQWVPLTWVGILILLSCQKKTTQPQAQLTISGVVQAGPVSNATVEIYAYDGTLKNKLGSTVTDSDGQFSVEIRNPDAHPFIVLKATGGQFKDEATQESVSLQAGEEIRSLYPTTNPSPQIPVTPITDMVWKRVEQNWEAAPSLESVYSDAKEEVAQVFGFKNPSDIFSLPNDPDLPQDPTTASGRNTLALTALSDAQSDEGLSASQKVQSNQYISDYFSRNGKVDIGSQTFDQKIFQSYQNRVGDPAVASTNFNTPVATPVQAVTSAQSCGSGAVLVAGQACCQSGGCDCGVYGGPVGQGKSCGDQDAPNDAPPPPPPTCPAKAPNFGGTCLSAGDKLVERCSSKPDWFGNCWGDKTKHCVPRSGCNVDLPGHPV